MFNVLANGILPIDANESGGAVLSRIQKYIRGK